MTYPGNPALSPEVQQRILTTYRQSVQGASQGNRDEALLGCDFVLRLDPQFAPAKALQQMLAAHRPPEAFLALLEEGDGTTPGDGGDLKESFIAMLGERRFAELLNAAERDKRRVGADAELRALVEQAQARHEAEPYVLKFAEAAETALGNGDEAEARRLLDKARSLDPSHPRAVALRTRLGDDVASAAAAAAAFLDSPSEMGEGALELPDLDFEAFSLTEEPAAGASADSDFAAGSAVGGEGSGRIAGLLAEGQSAYDRGEYQVAIDAWSRIFLIDIDHEEAARKIERARQLKSEREREVEEIFHDGVSKFDAGDLVGSRAAFKRVIDVQPGYALAREYLDKLDEREAGGELPGAGLPELAPISGGSSGAARGEARRPVPSGEFRSEGEGAAPAREGPRRAVGQGVAGRAKRSAAGPSPKFLIIGGAVLALLAIGGWLLYSQRERLFPNAAPPATAEAPADPLARARELHAEGKTAVAVSILRRIPPQDPSSGEAQSLISQWERIGGASQAASDEQLQLTTRRRALLEQAQRSLADGENFRARRYFAQAAELEPLDGDWVAMAASAEERLKPLAQESQLFKDGDFEFLVNQLWRRREAEPANRDVVRMIVDSYHNLGVLDLQRGDPAAAREKFREARAIDGSDPALQRLERFATTYETRGQDLLYRIFVKYLPLR